MFQAVFYHDRTKHQVTIWIRSQDEDGTPCEGSSGRTHSAGRTLKDVVDKVNEDHLTNWMEQGYKTFTFQFECPRPFRVQNLAERLIELQEKIRYAHYIMGVDEKQLTWEDKYDQIFGLQIIALANEVNLSVDWCNPDCGYDDDVKAFMVGVDALAPKIEALLNGIT